MTKNDKLISLVLEYQKTKNKDILKEIIELNQRLIDWYLENTKLNITSDELYNLIIKGITIAIITYNKDKNNNITRYLAMGIRNIIDEEIGFAIRSRKVLFETFLDYKRVVENRYGITLEKDFSILDDILDLMCEDRIFKENDKLEVKRRILEILKTYQGNLMLTNLNEVSFFSDFDNLDNIMKEVLSNLEYNILCFSYGLFNNPRLSLNDISKKYNICISTVKLYKNIALKKLRGYLEYYSSKDKIDLTKAKDFLTIILSKEEYNYLVLNNGLFGNQEQTQASLSIRDNVSVSRVANIINSALNKITFALNNYDKVVPGLMLIKPYLESTLSSLEFNIFASNYGLFGYPNLSISEICQEYNLDNQTVVYELNRDIKGKIKRTFYKSFTKEEVEEFLSNILSDLEFKVLTMYYGLYDKRKSQKEIANILNISITHINSIMQTCIEKIIVMINISAFNYDLSEVNNSLKSILDENEYLVLCYKYGLYNHDKLSLKEIANVLNISFKKVLVINNLLTIKLRRYLNLNNQEKVLAIK